MGEFPKHGGEEFAGDLSSISHCWWRQQQQQQHWAKQWHLQLFLKCINASYSCGLSYPHNFPLRYHISKL